MQLIEIEESLDGETAVIPLHNILKSIDVYGEKLHWSLLFLEAVGDLEDRGSMIEFEQSIKNFSQGLRITWDELIDLSERFEYVTDLLIIGSEEQSKLIRYKSDNEMYLSCDITIEIVDGFCWTVSSLNNSVIKTLLKKFEKTTIKNLIP